MEQKWWNLEANAHEKVVAIVNHLQQNQSGYSEEVLKYIKLYGNRDIQGLGYSQYSRVNADSLSNRVTLNVIKSCVDTAAAKVAKNRPKPMFLTEGGDYSLQKQARLLNQFVEGQYYATRIYEKGAYAFIDSAVCGLGALKIYRDESEICVERVMPTELIWDARDAFYGTPQSMYQVKTINRDVLLALYPQHKFYIESASAPKAGFSVGAYSDPAQLSEQVAVTEAWHLPSSPKAKDGKHVICIEGCTFVSEPYDKPYFPFATLRWAPKQFGFEGEGIAEELVGIQIEINKILMDIQRAQHLGSGFTLMVERGSKFIKTHANNEIGKIYEYTGVPPQIQVFQTVHPEIYAHLERLYMKAFEVTGISQLSAQSKKPSGLDSGKALREFNDIETERFALVGQRWEQFYLDVAAQMVDLAQEIYEDDKSFSILVKKKTSLQKINWKDINLDKTKYQMHLWPVSQLPSTPAGKLQAVQELMQAGLMDPETGLEVLDYPDLDRKVNLRLSARRLIQDIVEKMVEDGEYTSPEPFMDLKYAVSYTQTVYNQAKLDNVPDENLELLRRFMEQADLMQPKPMPPMDPMAQQMPAAPMPGMEALPPVI